MAWHSLFDGRSLHGWYWSNEPHAPAPSWAAGRGILRTTPGKGKEVYLLTRESFEDFEFRFEWRAEAGANSGVKYRIQRFGEPGERQRLEPVGLEYQITDDIGNRDAISTPLHSTGALYEYKEPSKKAPAQPGVWHKSRILARGLHIEHWLDEEKVIDIDLDTPAAAESFSHSKRQSAGMLRKQEKRSSPLALQMHDGVVEFRNLEIRALAAKP